jgi:hypothetical protein
LSKKNQDKREYTSGYTITYTNPYSGRTYTEHVDHKGELRRLFESAARYPGSWRIDTIVKNNKNGDKQLPVGGFFRR